MEPGAYLQRLERRGHGVEQLLKLQQFTFVCAPHPVQGAGLTAWEMDLEGNRADYRRKRDLLADGVRGHYEILGGEGAFYLFLKTPWGTGSEFVAEAIRNNLLIIPGGVFSSRDSHFRVSFAAADEVLVYAPGRPNVALWSRVFTQNWDRCYDFTGTDRSALLARLSRAAHVADHGMALAQRPQSVPQIFADATRVLDEALAFAKSREQFGRPIAEFQGLQWMLADMSIHHFDLMRRSQFPRSRIPQWKEMGQSAGDGMLTRVQRSHHR